MVLLVLLLLIACNHAKSQWSTQECKKSGAQATCLYKNIVFRNTGTPSFNMVLKEGKKVDIPEVALASKFDPFGWRPDVHTLKDKSHLASFLKDHVQETLEGYTFLVSLVFHHNIGHFLYDNLHAIHNAAMLYLPTPDTPFNVLVSSLGTDRCLGGPFAADCAKNEPTLQLFATFNSSGSLRYFKELKHTILIKNLIAGVKGMGIHSFVDHRFRLAQTVPNALMLFRNRMYTSHGLPIPSPMPGDMPHSVKVTAIIVDNKRYSEAERNMLREVAKDLTADPAAALDVKYIDWRSVGDRSLRDHLKLLSTTAIYVSGPGTGITYHPLMGNGSVLVSLGAVEQAVPGCGRPECYYPVFMEINIAATAWPYQRAIYYNSTLRNLAGGMQRAEIVRLLHEARKLVGRPAATVAGSINGRDPGWTNLSPEGQLLEDMCTTPAHSCTDLEDGVNNFKDNGWKCVVDGWMETIVYQGRFMSRVGAYDPESKRMESCPFVPHDLLENFKRSKDYAGRLATVEQVKDPHKL